MTQLCMKSCPGGGGFCCPLTHHLRGIEILFYEKWGFEVFLETSEISSPFVCSVKVAFSLLCQLASPSCTPLFFPTPVFPALFFLIHRQLPPPPAPFLGYCLCFLLCDPVGNSAFPVILLVGRFSVDFEQTVGSALREGLVLDLQSLLIILSSFKRPADNSQPPVCNSSHP